jgi:hypothetical protein
MILCPLLNPIRFYNSTPDYLSTFPNMDNVTQRTSYIDGIGAAQYYKEWLYGKQLDLQFEFQQGDNITLTAYKYNELTEAYESSATSSGIEITPSVWVGNKFIKHSFNLQEGTYYFEFADGLKSDVFVVTNSLFQRKKLIEIVYTNSENDYGCVFEDESLRNYFCGQLLIGNPENEMSGFESDRGNFIKLNATPKRIATLNINDLHYTYVDHVNMLFSLDSLTINGVTYQSSEPPTIEDGEFSDLKNITVKLIQTNNTYYYGR